MDSLLGLAMVMIVSLYWMMHANHQVHIMGQPNRYQAALDETVDEFNQFARAEATYVQNINTYPNFYFSNTIPVSVVITPALLEQNQLLPPSFPATTPFGNHLNGYLIHTSATNPYQNAIGFDNQYDPNLVSIYFPNGTQGTTGISSLDPVARVINDLSTQINDSIQLGLVPSGWTIQDGTWSLLANNTGIVSSQGTTINEPLLATWLSGQTLTTTDAGLLAPYALILTEPLSLYNPSSTGVTQTSSSAVWNTATTSTPYAITLPKPTTQTCAQSGNAWVFQVGSNDTMLDQAPSGVVAPQLMPIGAEPTGQRLVTVSGCGHAVFNQATSSVSYLMVPASLTGSTSDIGTASSYKNLRTGVYLSLPISPAVQPTQTDLSGYSAIKVGSSMVSWDGSLMMVSFYINPSSPGCVMTTGICTYNVYWQAVPAADLSTNLSGKHGTYFYSFLNSNNQAISEAAGSSNFATVLQAYQSINPALQGAITYTNASTNSFGTMIEAQKINTLTNSFYSSATQGPCGSVPITHDSFLESQLNFQEQGTQGQQCHIDCRLATLTQACLVTAQSSLPYMPATLDLNLYWGNVAPITIDSDYITQ